LEIAQRRQFKGHACVMGGGEASVKLETPDARLRRHFAVDGGRPGA
jgi:hypothetical protein